MERSMYYDRAGNAIDQETWIELRSADTRDEGRRVDETQVDSHWVSTVWLGLDHNFADTGPPLIFETMVFPESDYCVRTSTEEAAQAAHDQAVAHLRAGAHECRPDTHS